MADPSLPAPCSQWRTSHPWSPPSHPASASMQRLGLRMLLLAGLMALCQGALAQQSDAMRHGVSVMQSHYLLADLTYGTASGQELKMDVFVSGKGAPHPALVYFHGGGWVSGSKSPSMLYTLPYLSMGWTVVNVEYRMAGTALAPAAVEDVRCAVRYVLSRQKDFNIDPRRIVLSGHSAGGHLALIAGMLPVSAGLDRQCAGQEEIKVAAIVNWYGITDVADELDGPNRKEYAVRWLGAQPDRKAIAGRVSPLTWLRPGLPPVITIHGDHDNLVPYAHAVRLKEGLDRVGVANELVTVKDGGHGGFSQAEETHAYEAIEAFLRKTGVMP